MEKFGKLCIHPGRRCVPQTQIGANYHARTFRERPCQIHDRKGWDAYRIHIQSDAGETMELSATYEQLKLLVETLDELLGADDSGTAIDVEDTPNAGSRDYHP